MINFLKQGNRLLIFMVITIIIFVIVVLDMMPEEAITDDNQIQDSSIVYISCGPERSEDHTLGVAISGQISDIGIKTKIIETADGAESMSKVLDSTTVLALVYSPDMAGHEDTVKSMADMGTAELFVLAKEGISSISDLAGKNVAVGLENSSGQAAAKVVLPMYDMSYEDIVPVYGDAFSLLANGEADAAFVVGASVATLPGGYELIPIDRAVSGEASAAGWQSGTIAPGVYDNDLPVDTVAVNRYLVCDPTYPQGAADILEDIISEGLEELKPIM